jgi:hypothetical protein
LADSLSDSDSDEQRKKKHESAKKRKRSEFQPAKKKERKRLRARAARLRLDRCGGGYFGNSGSVLTKKKRRAIRTPSPVSPRAARYLTARFLMALRNPSSNDDDTKDNAVTGDVRGSDDDDEEVEEDDSADELFDPHSPVSTRDGTPEPANGPGGETPNIGTCSSTGASTNASAPRFGMPLDWKVPVYAYTPDGTPVYMVPVPKPATLLTLIRAKQNRLLKEAEAQNPFPSQDYSQMDAPVDARPVRCALLDI